MSEHVEFSARELLRTLVGGRVEFVVMGGLATQAHGSPIITSDLDICPDPDLSNIERLAMVLSDLAAVRRGSPEAIDAPLDPLALGTRMDLTLRTRYGDLDLVARPEPALDYQALRSRAERFEFEGTTVLMASIDDLIAMKRAAGRPQDLLMLEHLGALREEIDRRTID